jgi:membrane-associated protein
MVDAAHFIEQFSVIGALAIIGLMVYAESGFLLGLFLPGDTLLVVVGVFAAQGELPLWWAMLIIFVAAVLGDNTGYFIGKTTGPRIFVKHKGLLFRKDYIDRAEAFYARHGGKTIIVARFIGYVRTIVPIIAGIGRMHRPKFIFYNILGAAIWTLTFVLLGYWLGNEIADEIHRYFIPSLIIGALIFLGPSLAYLIKTRLVKRFRSRQNRPE